LVMFPPMFFLVWTRLRKPRADLPEQPQSELRGIDPAYYKFLTTTRWEDPAHSTQDFVLCLTEQWTSAVLGFALFGLFIPHPVRCPCRLLVRLASVVSVHQYQKLYYHLHRLQQPRPLALPVWILQGLIRKLESTTRWFIAVDLALCLSAVTSFYHLNIGAGPLRWCLFCLGATGSLLGTCYYNPAVMLTMGKYYRPVRKFIGFPLAWLFLRHYGKSMHLNVLWLQTLQWADIGPSMLLPIWESRRVILSSVAILGTVALPLFHIGAFAKLVRVAFTHDLSLSLDPDVFMQKLQLGNGGTDDVMQWRYRLAWREPQRVLVTWHKWKRQFWYWLFFSGSVEDKLRQQQMEENRRQSDAKRRGLTVWQRVASEKDQEVVDRSQWKQRAMDRLAEKHRRDYERGTYEVGVTCFQYLPANILLLVISICILFFYVAA